MKRSLCANLFIFKLSGAQCKYKSLDANSQSNLVAFYYLIFSSDLPPCLPKPILSHIFSCSIFEINNLSFFGELENDEMLSGEDYCFVLELQVLVDLVLEEFTEIQAASKQTVIIVVKKFVKNHKLK